MNPLSGSRHNLPQSPFPMTPSVALRALFEQVRSFRQLVAAGRHVDVHAHFQGPIRPPRRGASRPMGDPVFNAVADYASKLIARSGLLTIRNGLDDRGRLDENGRLTRTMFAAEHALAMDLARVADDVPLREREVLARGILALAAFWCDRSELEGLGTPHAHPLLGRRPSDTVGRVLWDHAATVLAPPAKRSGGGRLGNDMGIDIGIGRGA